MARYPIEVNRDPLTSAELYIELCTELCVELRVELYVELCAELCVKLCTELRVELHAELRVELRAELCVELCVELRAELRAKLRAELCAVLWYFYCSRKLGFSNLRRFARVAYIFVVICTGYLCSLCVCSKLLQIAAKSPQNRQNRDLRRFCGPRFSLTTTRPKKNSLM